MCMRMIQAKLNPRFKTIASHLIQFTREFKKYWYILWPVDLNFDLHEQICGDIHSNADQIDGFEPA